MGWRISAVVFLFLGNIAGAVDRTNDVTAADLIAGFSINNNLKPILTVVRGYTYRFTGLANTSLHPFKLTTSSTGGTGSSIFTNQVTGAQPVCTAGCAGTSFDFTPDSATPDLIYYQCNVHQNMGNQIRVVDPTAVTSLVLTGGLIGITYTNPPGTAVTVQRATNLFSNDWMTIQAITTSPHEVSVTVSNDVPAEFFRLATPLP